MTEDRVVRDADRPGDAGACAAIYAPYVTDTAISFETVAPSAEEMAQRIERARRTHAWLVLEEAGAVVGYAYAGPFRERAAYRWSCEVSVYLKQDHGRRGGGRLLYDALLERLVERGYRTAAAGMTLPNAASERFHEAMGFEPVGTYRGIGWKHGRWRDVAWAQKALVPSDEGDPAPPS
ncbi:GNAT family N-acetyltransferase [Luteipulveratus sp. YIM 133132]|uniref:GNAT family N-acetyltransferase n=1 Tax=Luteipulveratus flavus TaxID=3031728 RepID=UPI0023AEC90D|nr:GNAT family N-acetyltransferase [Luteipulveratus sp. YIM 133132]MDE9365513.1 GNAT family N-acetyltransferase [Luteipulveratus sp. YIM 133132]